MTIKISGFALDDGGRTGKLVIRSLETSQIVSGIGSYTDLLDLSKPGDLWVTEKAAIMYDLAYHDAIVHATRMLDISWKQIPNEIVNASKWDEGKTGPASDKEASKWILDYARTAIEKGLPAARMILSPEESTTTIKSYSGPHAALNTQRDKVMGDYILLRRCSWNTRELPQIDGVSYPSWLLNYREKEKSLFLEVGAVADAVSKKFGDKPERFLEELLSNGSRLYGFLIPMISIARTHSGLRAEAYKHFINLTAINGGGFGSVWSADVKHNMQPAWIRNTYGAEMDKTPATSGKLDKNGEIRKSYKRQEYRPEFRKAFWAEFHPAMKNLLYAVMDVVNDGNK